MSGRKRKKAKGSSRRASSKARSKTSKTDKAHKTPKTHGPRAPWLLLGVGTLALVVGGLVYAERSGADQHDTARDVTAEPAAAPPVAPVAATVPEALTLRVVARYPHDTSAFTQGLLWHDGRLYESTGLEGHSSLRRVNLDDGTIERRVDLPDEYFAEGLALVGDELFQLTWRDGVAFVWDRRTFDKKREHHYDGEGWGLCWDGTHLVMSDGSDRLFFRNPQTFEIDHTVRVTKIGRPVRYLNELECVEGAVYANVWQRDEIVRIEPRTGRVTASIDASGLLTPLERRSSDVLNGIASRGDDGRLLVTGKLWPWLFEVELVPRR